MIEAEWWDYDSAEEMAGAVAGDVGFIIESALDARGEARDRAAGGKTPVPVYDKLAAKDRLEERDDRPRRRPAGAGRQSAE